MYRISESRTILPPLDYHYLFTGLLASERNIVCCRCRYLARGERVSEADGCVMLELRRVDLERDEPGKDLAQCDKLRVLGSGNERQRCVEPALASSSRETSRLTRSTLIMTVHPAMIQRRAGGATAIWTVGASSARPYGRTHALNSGSVSTQCFRF
jgi:hypothetical protein